MKSLSWLPISGKFNTTQRRCNIFARSCPFEAIEIKDSADCVRINPESFRLIKKEESCEECEECLSIQNCPIKKIISTDIFGVRGTREDKRTIEGSNTCFICRGTPACMNMKTYRGLKQIAVSFFYCFLLIVSSTILGKALRENPFGKAFQEKI
jgi:ferredoxin